MTTAAAATAPVAIWRRWLGRPWPWVLGCAALLPWLAWQPQAIARQYALDALWNLGHIVLFALATVAATLWLGRRVRFVPMAVGLLVVGATLGGVIEWLQSLIGRDASALDVVRDVAGISAVLTPVAWLRGRKGWAGFGAAVAVPLLTWLITPAVSACADSIDQYRQFPVLVDWHSARELQRFRPSPRLQLQSANNVRWLRVTLATTRFSGFSLVNFPRDWRGFHTVRLQLGNPSAQPLALTCKIADLAHDNRFSDRYNHRFVLPGGRSTVVIDLARVHNAPATRPMNMARIAELSCFATNLAHPRAVDVYRIALAGG